VAQVTVPILLSLGVGAMNGNMLLVVFSVESTVRFLPGVCR
jgi:hypothetical protein